MLYTFFNRVDGKKNESIYLIFLYICVSNVFRGVVYLFRIKPSARLWPDSEIIESERKRKVARSSTHGKTITRVPSQK